MYSGEADRTTKDLVVNKIFNECTQFTCLESDNLMYLQVCKVK